MKTPRKRVMWLFLPVIACALAGVAILSHIGRGGSGAVERWVADQLQAVARAYLEPRLVIGDFDYRYPRTVVLSGCRLVVEDPATPGATVDILEVSRLLLRFAEAPRYGKPLKIERLDLKGATIRLLESGSAGVEFLGYNRLLKQPSQVDGETVSLSDVFQVQSIGVEEASVLYDPRDAAATPMRLTGIKSRLNLESRGGGRYEIDVGVTQEALLQASMSGTIDIENLDVDVREARVRADLGSRRTRHLPPALQKILRDHEITGRLDLAVEGSMPAADWRRSTVTARLAVEDAHVALGGIRLPVEAASCRLRVSGDVASADELTVSVAGGRVTGEVSFGLEGDRLSRCLLRAEGLRLERFLRARVDADPATPGLSGEIGGTVDLSFARVESAGGISGAGEISLREGRLARLPLITKIAETFRKKPATQPAPETNDELAGKDRADLVFSFEGDRVHFSSIKARGSGYGLRGEGDVFLDSRLDLRVNAGPLEILEEKLGAVGNAIAKMRDGLLRYSVTGTLGEPRIGVKVADLGKVSAVPAAEAPAEVEGEPEYRAE